MKSIFIRFNEIPSDECSKMPHFMELFSRLNSVVGEFGFSVKVNFVDGFEFSFYSDEECSALLLIQVANNVLDYLQKIGFLSVCVRNLNFY